MYVHFSGWACSWRGSPKSALRFTTKRSAIPPVGGHTEFADERAAYDALPEDMKRRLDRLVAEHSIFNSRARLAFTNFSDEERQQMPPVPQVLVPLRVVAECEDAGTRPQPDRLGIRWQRPPRAQVGRCAGFPFRLCQSNTE
ncbi:MAG: TauD/TfdA family dioxygenase [Alphaproteobacteria bacterium]|nr:MAG: TauD/TfdA family dioxygenase [Alphaproteobacteria bacterium]